MDITKVLLDAQHPDDGIRSAAEADLKRLQEVDLHGFLMRLSSELSNDDSPPESRRLAGTILKDSFCSDDRVHPINDPLVQRWFSLDPSIQSKIKESSLTTALASPVADARRASSHVIAMVARMDQWPDLLARLLGNAAQRQALSPPLCHHLLLEAVMRLLRAAR